MQSSNDLSESLTGGGGDDASQSSQRSGTSLLDRIRAQQNREATQGGTENSAPTHIQVPQYSPVPTSQGFGNHNNNNADGGDNAGSSNFFSNAWSNISASMENGMASMEHETGGGDGMDDALLAPTSTHHQDGLENYTMSGYFMTFVRDIYNLFLSMPVWGRAITVVVLLAIALKLL
jgi:hypothetical protein